ncbi:MAG: hypothetical protein ONB48_06280 [candidate division KSB1 bacterium]|nr:hypothetical protein [candidate division KSB1 bacterium]MDZ7273148.1 hypothetical protein [candidate division KSB1 bacterium]MDZ7285250.1 hypothetical protein [candidate division KSB1 bacterium]MDZ7298282.1 hypothetical protein [candidate division KSB1 bacterium]MDZ7306637.1 hypothetical protein [candidate division KSB1 bacterium]
MLKKSAWLAGVAFCLWVLNSCNPKATQHPGETDQYGCKEPPPSVFTAAGIDAEFAQSKFGQIVTGDINIKTNPEVISLASKAVMDSRIFSYLRCLAIRRDGYTLEQAVYLEELSSFMRTNPTAEQFIRWKNENPFPGSMTSAEPPAPSDELVQARERIRQLEAQLQEAQSQLKQIQESGWTEIARANGWVSKNECDSAWKSRKEEGRDREGRRIRLKINTLTQEYRWVFERSDLVEAFAPPVDPRVHVRELNISGARHGIICVGTASSEGERGDEESRARSRAERLQIIFREEFQNLPPLYTLSLGQFRHPRPTLDPRATRDERRVIVIEILEREDNVNLREALKDALLKAIESTRSEGAQPFWDFRDYTAFDLYGG